MSKTTTIGGHKIGKVGHGLMMMTWIPKPAPDEQYFEAIKGGIETVSQDGAKMLLNSGEFYGGMDGSPRTSNLTLISRFFAKYPELADKAFLSVKGGTGANDLTPDASEANIRRSVDAINEALGGKKRLDLYQNARVDSRYPIEETIGILKKLIEEGKFDHIGMSECSAETLRKAHSVHPIAAVEIEISPWSYEEETRKVIATAKELGVTVVAYSPLGRGFLTGQIQRASDFPEGDWRRNLARFQDDAIQANLSIVEALKKIAEKKGVTPAQLSIAWVSALGQHVVPIPGSSNVKRTLENLKTREISLTEDELAEIKKVIDSAEIKGGRYFGAPDPKAEGLWG